MEEEQTPPEEKTDDITASAGAGEQVSDSQPEEMVSNHDSDTQAPKGQEATGRHKTSKRKIILLALAVLLVVGGAGAAYRLSHQTTPAKSSVNTAQPIVKQQQTVSGKLSDDTDTYRLILLKSPQEVANPHLYADLGAAFGADCDYTGPNGDIATNCKPYLKESDLRYYKVGQTDNGQSILVLHIAGNDKLEGTSDYVIVEDSPGKYKLIALASNLYIPDDETKQDRIKGYLNGMGPNLTLDLKSRIPVLEFPDTATTDAGGTYKFQRYGDWAKYNYGTFTPDAKAKKDTKITLLNSDGNLKVYESTTKQDDNSQIRRISAKINDMFTGDYMYADSLLTDKPMKITWAAGETATHQYFGGVVGCGYAYGYATATNISTDQLAVVGKTADDRTVYSVSTATPLFKHIYKDDYAGGTTFDKSVQNLTEAEFQAKHALIIIKNPLGEYQIYMRDDMFNYGGCGKPVIYLYPTKTTSVDVKVGAVVTESDPSYTPVGWQHVLAKPNGQLTYNGHHYPYLFWEGTGLGTYPNVTQGTVVARSKAIATITSQLKKQGFNAKETADFLDFWGPKLPDSPYIRLTWFNTQQMNQLAPLSISPKPMTVIRTFLDFQGLNRPVPLSAQHFSTPERKGFTIVEWGGLLTSNSD